MNIQATNEETRLEQDNTPEPEIPATDSEATLAALLPDDINFPKLQSPYRKPVSPPSQLSPAHNHNTPQLRTPQAAEKTPSPAFVWRSKPPNEDIQRTPDTQPEKRKQKPSIPKIPDSAPITRQGYRTGRLAEDFWSALGIPNTPSTTRKTLHVVPFLVKDQLPEQAEYLVDKKIIPHTTIALVQIAELLAGIPWTTRRAREHVVNETSQALHKVLIFNNNLSNPFQKWSQGRWFANWREDADGEHTCTLIASITVPEAKVKPRKGQNFKWQPIPTEIQAQIAAHTLDNIAPIELIAPWIDMVGKHQHNLGTQQNATNHRTATSNKEAPTSGAATQPDLHER